MQVLELELTFGEDESNIGQKTIDLRVDDKYPLQFSIMNANYKINSFEQKSNVQLQLNSITPTYDNKYYTGCEYNVNLYLKFPLNTFPTNNKVVDLTFDEYNSAIKKHKIEFISLSQFEEKNENKKENDKSYIIVIAIVIAVFIFTYLVQKIYDAKSKKKYQFEQYKSQVRRKIRIEYIRYNTLEDALKNGMPDKIEYKVIWLRQKTGDLHYILSRGPNKSERTWHGPYGWSYHSTAEDIRKFKATEQEYRICEQKLHSMELQQSADEKDKWYWKELPG